MSAQRYWATYERVCEHTVGHACAIITLYLGNEWAGATRIDVRLGRGHNLREVAFTRAEQMAAVKGGQLERFSDVYTAPDPRGVCGMRHRKKPARPVGSDPS